MSGELSPYFKEKFSLSFFQNKRFFSAFAACIAGVMVLVLYFQSGPKLENYALAEESVSQWVLAEDEASYIAMRKALRKVPALEQKYGAMIAQKLFENSQLSEALTLAHESLKRVEDDAPFHAAYGETTLMIEKGAYQDALERSVGLKELMARTTDLNQVVGGQPTGGAVLFAHNLLRIACLQKELKNKPGEKAAWEELEVFLQEKEFLSGLVFENFREKGLDLAHYITERKKHL